MAGNLEQALEYASQGFRVFPLFYVVKGGLCSCRSKKPCKRIGKHPMTQNGVQDATLDEAQIRQWWTETPWANIGLATGHGGLIVMDVDDAGEKTGSETLKALVERYGSLPETRMVRTGSGGRHFYFYSAHEIANSAGKVGKYIDIRGYGGYVILPPSNHVSGNKYQWLNDLRPADMPPWLENLAMVSKIDLAADSPGENDPAIKDAREKDQTNKLTGDQLIRLLDYIPPDCDRDTWWQVGAALKKELGDKKGFEAWDAWSKKAPDKYDSKVMPVQWNSFTDKGLTAGTIHHFAKTLGDFRGFDIEAADSKEFRDEWCLVASIKRFVQVRTLVEWDKEQFDMIHAPLFNGTPSKHVLKNPNFRRVQSATYWPNEPIWVTEDGQSKLNYWRPSGLTARRGDVTPFLRHVQYLFPDGLEGKILIDYLAYQVQYPGEKVHWAVLIEGAQGNGKSFFGELMSQVLGPRNVRRLPNEVLHETFTGWQRNTQLIVIEEMMARQRLELMNKLKPMITEPWCQIREMYRPPYDQPNRFNFLFFTNHRDSLIIDRYDRRYCILKTESPAHPDGNAYYGPLFYWMRNNADVMLWYLGSEVKLDGFKAKAHAPMTAGKRDLISQSMMPLDAFIHERVEMGEHPFDCDLVDPCTLIDFLGKYNLKGNPRDVGSAFQRLGYLNLGQVRGKPGESYQDTRVRLWAVRNVDTYKDLDAGQLRRIWLSQTNGIRNEASPDTEELVAKKMKDRAPVNPLKDREPM